jgi:hypothetical protein
MMLKRTWLLIALIPLLLAAQHVAMAHQLGHVFDPLPVQLSGSGEGKKSADSVLCDYHVAFAEILGAIGSKALPARFAATTIAPSVGPAHTIASLEAPTPTSRGPPVLL